MSELLPQAGIMAMIIIVALKHGKLAEAVNISISIFHKIPMFG